MKNSIVKDAMRLFIITLISGIILGFFYDLTKGPIAAQEEKTRTAAYQAVLPDADKFETATDTAYSTDIEAQMQPFLNEAGYTSDSITGLAIASTGGTYSGVVVTVTAHDGYDGDIQFSVGILPDGTISGISILSISETAGLGMRAKNDPSFLSQWTGMKQDSFDLVKSGGDPASGTVDAISGSTVTSKAFQRGINAALIAFRNLQNNNITTAGGVTIG